MSVKIETKGAWDLYSELYPRICGARSDERVILLRGRKMEKKQALMDECSAALQFPPRHGENWDAFSEDLFALDWMPENRKVLAILCNAESRVRIEQFLAGLRPTPSH